MITICEVCKSKTDFFYSQTAGGYLCNFCLDNPTELLFRLISKINRLEEQTLRISAKVGGNMQCAYCSKKLKAITAIWQKQIEEYLCKECFEEEQNEQKEQSND